jgi:hypothetical protein
VIVGGQRAWDFLSGCEALDMLTYRPDSKSTVIPDMFYDLHLDQLNQLHAVTSGGVNRLMQQLPRAYQREFRTRGSAGGGYSA